MDWKKLLHHSAIALLIGALGHGTARQTTAQEESDVARPISQAAGVVRLSDQPARGGIRLVSFDQQAACTPCSQACAHGACMNGACRYRGGARCESGRCQHGHGGCRPYKYNLYSFHDAGDDLFGWAGYDSGHQCDQHYPNSAHCRGGCWLDDQADMFFARNKQNSDIFCDHIHGKFAYFTPMGNGGEGAPPFGHYNLVYAANPSYFDPRDSNQYAAPGWGAPMAVPLAPMVRHTMNYSSGMPASRLTPISNVLPPRGRRSR